MNIFSLSRSSQRHLGAKKLPGKKFACPSCPCVRTRGCGYSWGREDPPFSVIVWVSNHKSHFLMKVTESSRRFGYAGKCTLALKSLYKI